MAINKAKSSLDSVCLHAIRHGADAKMNHVQIPIKNYQQFYQFYLTEHHDLTCRRLHFVGSSIGLYMIAKAITKKQKRYLVYGLLAGYACAWVGHFGFEKNKPASFKQPFYSFISDWRMFSHIVTGQISLIDQKKDKFFH